MEKAQVSVKPLTKDEVKILVTFIEKSKVILNKATNATSNKMKTEEWQCIADQFNAVISSCHRTPQQLRLKWENLKKNSRKRNTQIRMNNIKTGGGLPDYIPPDEVLDRVASLLGNTVDGLSVGYGGDAEAVEQNWVSVNVGGGSYGDGSCIKSGSGTLIIPLEGPSLDPRTEVLGEMITTNDENLLECPAMNRHPSFFKIILDSKTSPFGHKRKLIPKTDENRSVRNLAIANYYITKNKLLEAKMQNVLLEYKKLQLEVEKLQKE